MYGLNLAPSMLETRTEEIYAIYQKFKKLWPDFTITAYNFGTHFSRVLAYFSRLGSSGAVDFDASHFRNFIKLLNSGVSYRQAAVQVVTANTNFIPVGIKKSAK